MTTNPTPQQRAITLLRIHGGAVSVPQGCAIAIAFQIMEESGEVKINPSGTPNFIDVYSLDFKGRFNGHGEN